MNRARALALTLAVENDYVRLPSVVIEQAELYYAFMCRSDYFEFGRDHQPEPTEAETACLIDYHKRLLVIQQAQRDVVNADHSAPA